MRVGITTYGYLYTASLESSLESIARAGFRLVEIAPLAPHLTLTGREKAHTQALRLRLERLHLTCVSVNAPELNLISANPQLRDVALEQYRNSIALAAELGAQVAVVIPGRRSQLIPMPEEAAVRLALEQLSLLTRDAHQHHVNLALEPVPFGFAESAGEVASLVRQIGDDRVGMALDVANIHGREDVPGAVSLAGSSLLIAHLSDTWRDRWAHTSIGTAEVDFAVFTRALRSIDFTGPCIYELVDGFDPGSRLANDLRGLRDLGLEP
jgi:sugar phosphate isomerase/epimerase